MATVSHHIRNGFVDRQDHHVSLAGQAGFGHFKHGITNGFELFGVGRNGQMLVRHRARFWCSNGCDVLVKDTGGWTSSMLPNPNIKLYSKAGGDAMKISRKDAENRKGAKNDKERNSIER